MSEPSYLTADDDGKSGSLPGLLNGAADSFRTVAVTYRTWRHEQRLREAFRASVEERKWGGVAFGAVARGDVGPAETGETLRIWREGQRVRQEHHGGPRDGSYGVVDGPRWWSWSEQMGAMSNRDDASVDGDGIDGGFEFMLDPAPLVDMLEFRVAGHSRIANRATLTVHAAPRREILSDVRAPNFSRVFRTMHALGSGADSYHFEVDQQRGVLLASTAIRNEQPLYTITAFTITFDEPIPADTFVFTPPEGEQIRSRTDLVPRPQHVSVTEAQRRAAFTVLVPDPLPTGWQDRTLCLYSEESTRVAASALLVYHSDTGHQTIMIRQIPVHDAPRHYGMIFDDQSWHEVLRDGTLIKISAAGEDQQKAYLTRNDTFAYLTSKNLTTDELTTIAASLRPAPKSDPA
jgi:hypothetical protein